MGFLELSYAGPELDFDTTSSSLSTQYCVILLLKLMKQTQVSCSFISVTANCPQLQCTPGTHHEHPNPTEITGILPPPCSFLPTKQPGALLGATTPRKCTQAHPGQWSVPVFALKTSAVHHTAVNLSCATSGGRLSVLSSQKGSFRHSQLQQGQHKLRE